MNQTILKLLLKAAKVLKVSDETQTTLGNSFGKTISEGNRTTFPLVSPLIDHPSLGESWHQCFLKTQMTGLWWYCGQPRGRIGTRGGNEAACTRPGGSGDSAQGPPQAQRQLQERPCQTQQQLQEAPWAVLARWDPPQQVLWSWLLVLSKE